MLTRGSDPTNWNWQKREALSAVETLNTLSDDENQVIKELETEFHTPPRKTADKFISKQIGSYLKGTIS
jgi:hypothetical protein